MATLKDTEQLTSKLEDIVGELRSELTNGNVDFQKIVSLADELGEQADGVAETFNNLNETLMQGLERVKSGGGKSACSVADWVGQALGCWLGKRVLELGDAAAETAWAAAVLWLVVWADWPATLNLIVRHGASTMSSWSWPKVLAPFRASTPTTLSGMLLTRSTWSIGDSLPNSSRTIV